MRGGYIDGGFRFAEADMRKTCVAFALWLVLTPLAAQAPAGGTALPEPSRTESLAPGKDFLVVFSVGPGWISGKPPGEQAGFREHGSNLKRLRDAGRIVLGARYADKGMIVLRAESETAARTELEADPGVRAGIFTFELNELRVFYDGYLARPGPPKS
jgi:hypothetical protein